MPFSGEEGGVVFLLEEFGEGGFGEGEAVLVRRGQHGGVAFPC